MDGPDGDSLTQGVAGDALALRQPRCAYVTLVTSDSYVDGALVLLYSLRRALTPYSIVCLATPTSLSASSLQRLRRHFDGVIETDLHRSSDHRALAILGRPDLWSTLTKIQLWNPALFGAWDAICYLDADTLVRQPIDDMFARLQPWRNNVPGWRQGGLISAAPDTGWPDCFNSGVLLLAPGHECYEALVRRAAQKNASFDGADQGLFNEHFSDWATDLPYRRLPFLYNATANVYYEYEPALQRFGHGVRVVHFIGISKPWHWERTPGGQLSGGSSSSERWRQLVNLWWCIHDEHVSGWRFWKGPFSKDTALGKGYHSITKPVTGTSCEQGSGDARDGGKSPDTRNKEDSPKVLDRYRKEVSDWDKDWSWATDRVHPLDYAYLTTHTELPPTQQPDEHREQSVDADHRPFGTESSDPLSHGSDRDRLHEQSCLNDLVPSCSLTNDTGYDGDSSSGYSSCDSRTANSGSNDQDQSHRGQAALDAPEWMQSQRPWEDVAREGWMHNMDYQPHKYDQAYVGRRVIQALPANPHMQPHDGQRESQPHYTPMPLQKNQTIYEATQIVLQPHDRHDRPERNQSHEHGDSQQSYDQEGGSFSAEATRSNEHNEYHRGYSGHTAGYSDNQLQHQQQAPEHNGRTSTPAASPLYVPQPKSPVAVNPVALWESNEEQYRRRAWAEQLRSVPNNSAPNLGDTTFTQQTPYSAPGSASVSGLDNRFSVSAMDHVDSRQLPKETPWKIGHVRQRKAEGNTLQNSMPTGIQFKEGVANDGNAREAAGQLLRRWNESVVARRLKPRLGSITLDDISHSDAKVERGTDAIRLETTVSCEAENSNGERTVYRFTLSSTLDVGGVQQPTQLPVSTRQHQFRAGSDSRSSVSSGMEDTGAGGGDDGIADNDRYVVTDLLQPDNYQEPAMSRRSSFVQLPLTPNSTRVPHLSLQPRLGTGDQFSEADARYWRLQRQLIDLEMSQQHSDHEMQRRVNVGAADSSIGFSGGWARQPSSDLYDLASPPTPTRKQVVSGFTVPERRLARRSSAFSIADPNALAECSSADLEVAIPDIQAKQNAQPSATVNVAGILGRDRSWSSSRTATSNQEAPSHDSNAVSVAYRQPLNNDLSKPEHLKNSRSHSDLRRIAAENSAQAVVFAGEAGDNDDSQQILDFGVNPVERPAFVASPTNNSELDSGTGHDKPGDSEDEKQYKSAIGRHPTPFPRKQRDSPEIVEDDTTRLLKLPVDSHALSRPEKGFASPLKPASLHVKSDSLDLGTANSDAPSAPVSTPSTPGKQRIRPRVVWDDDDDGYIPPDNDKSLDAQWLRIIRGAPPPRANVVPTKELTHKPSKQADVSDVLEISRQQAPTEDVDSVSSNKLEDGCLAEDSGKETIPANEIPSNGKQAQHVGSNSSKKPKERALGEDSDGSPKKQSQTGILSKSPGGTFDPLSDSEADPEEDKLQERFWARAIRPSKSGSSTPYSPRRSKSVVEMSSSISPKDLAEWMRWQGDNSKLDLEGFSDTPDEPAVPNESKQQQLPTPPSSKDANAGLQTPDARLADTSLEHFASSEGDDPAYDRAIEGGDTDYEEEDDDDDDDESQLEIWHQEHRQAVEYEADGPDATLEALDSQNGSDLGSASTTRTTSVK